MKSSSVVKLLVAALVAIAGLSYGGVQLQFGPITLINYKSKVENGSQTQTVVQPVRPTAEVKKTETIQAAPPVSQTVGVQAPQSQPVSESHHVAKVPRTQYYESDDEYESVDCTCPADEEYEDEGEDVEEDDGGGLKAAA
jgi:hypothetical protein